MKTFYKKFMTLAICLVCMGLCCSTLFAQQADIETYQQSRNEYVFNLQISDRAELETLTKMASIAKVNGNEVLCFANQKEFDALKAAGYELKLVDNRPSRETFPMWSDGDYNYDCYLTYEDFEWMMDEYVQNHSNCSLVNLGATPGGHEIIGVRINHINEWRCPKVLLTGAIHGNEMLTTVAMMKLINTLLTDTSDEVQYLRDNLDIFILPMLNPDGTYYVENKSVDGATRGNKNGVDLNRNFPDNIGGAHPDGESYQAETQMLMDFMDAYDFTFAANYHSGGAIVNYPWDNTSTSNHVDRNWWEYVSAQYVATARTTAHTLFGNNKTYMRSGNRVGDFPNGYVRGADWYLVQGGQQDYMNYYAACPSVTVEIFQDGEVENTIGQTYSPKLSTSIAKYVNANIPATLQLMKEATFGIRGRVRESESWDNIEGATVSIDGHDAIYSSVTTSERGMYYRPIKGGTYNVTYSAPGYTPQTIQVTVVDGQTITQDVFLELEQQSITADFNADATVIMPTGIVQFTDASSGAGEFSYSWSFEGGMPATSTDVNPQVWYENAGVYDVTLTVTNNHGATATLTKSDYITVENAIRMCNGSSMIVEPVNFYDSGGADANYSNNESYVYTFYPYMTDHHNLVVTFNSFNTEKSYDKLSVYRGSSINSPLIDTYHGNGVSGNNHAPVEVITNNGPLTFKFVSDRSTTESGWSATVSCVMDPVYSVSTMVEGNGTLTVDPTEGFEDDVVNVTAEAAEGYQLTELYYVKADGTRVDINMNTLVFTLPASNVVVHAVFTELPDQITVNMTNGSVTTGNALFYDSGGQNRYYRDRETYTYTFYPNVQGGLIKAEFLFFHTENRYDMLYVYDGATASNDNLIASLCGYVNPGTFVSSTGPLTFKFTSDVSAVLPGWEALITTEVYTVYDINIDNDINYGTVAADREKALAGTVVNLTATPADPEHNFFVEWNVTSGGQAIEVVDNQFVMPEGDVNVSATFAVGTYHPSYYQLITTADELVPGRYIIASAGDGNMKAVGAYGTSATWQGGMTYYFSYFRRSVDAVVENSIMTSHEGACEFILDGFAGQCTFFDEDMDGYMYCNRYQQGNSVVYALCNALNPSNKTWEVKFYDGGEVKIRNNKYAREMGLNAEGDQFSVFTVGYKKRLYLYKKVEGWWTPNAKATLELAENAEVSANVYPNPTTGVVTLEAEGMQQLSVFNVMGQEVMNVNAEGNVKTLNLDHLDAGIYLIRIYTDNGVAVKRVNLMH